MDVRPSVAVVVFRRREPRFLLLERVPAKGGGWQPVTGRVEAADGEGEAALARAALREVEEETGCSPVALVDLDLVAEFTGYDGRRYRERSFAAEVPDEAEPTRGDEHAAHAWFTLEEALRALRWDENKRALEAAARLSASGSPGGGPGPPATRGPSR